MAPSLVSIEIGNVDASTVVATFSEAVTSPTYSQGWSFAYDGVEQAIASATRQADRKVVYFVLGAEATSSTVVTAEYVTEPAADEASVWDAHNAWTPPDWRK